MTQENDKIPITNESNDTGNKINSQMMWQQTQSKVKARQSFGIKQNPNSSEFSGELSLSQFNSQNDSMHDKSIFSKLDVDDEMTHDKLLSLEQVFNTANTNDDGGLDIEEFKNAMRRGMGYNMTDHELISMFMKVDTNCDGTVDWDEYLSFLLMEFRERDLMKLMIQRKPFPKHMKMVPNICHYLRRHDTIVRLRYQPSITKYMNNLYSIQPQDLGGKYISVSKDGIINFWSMELNHLRKHKLPPPKSTRKNIGLWVTDLICAPNLNIIAIASTSGTIVFYDLTAYSFQEILTLANLEICVTCMDYWVDPNMPSRAKLFWGDTRGNVAALVFDTCASICFLQPTINKQFKKRVEFPDLLKQTTCGVTAYTFPKVHEDLVIEIKYFHMFNECFMSCCRGSRTSLYVGDLHGRRASYFSVNKGVQTFDYSRKHNVIVTGGKDSLIRVWNPYVNSAPVMVIQGTKIFILHVFVHEQGEYIFSVAQDKDIHVFDMNTQICIQLIHKKWVPLGPRLITAAVFNIARHALVLGNNKMAILEHGETDLLSQQLISHTNGVSHMLYNSLFHQVVSAGLDSLVVVWNPDTGERFIQFTAHKINIVGETDVIVEMTAMRFDPSLRRLITAAQDGYIKLWNHNNGALLRAIKVHDTTEIVDIVCPKQRIMTAGWNRRISVYIDSYEDDSMHMWKRQHHEDITSFSFRPPHTVVSGSHDGDINIWLLETGHVTLRFNAHISTKPISRLQGQNHFNSKVKPEKSSSQHPSAAAATVISSESNNTVTDTGDSSSSSCSTNSKLLDEDEEGNILKQFMSYNTHRASIAAEVPVIPRNENKADDNTDFANIGPRTRAQRLPALPPQLATIGELGGFTLKESSYSMDQSISSNISATVTSTSTCILLPPPTFNYQPREIGQDDAEVAQAKSFKEVVIASTMSKTDSGQRVDFANQTMPNLKRRQTMPDVKRRPTLCVDFLRGKQTGNLDKPQNNNGALNIASDVNNEFHENKDLNAKTGILKTSKGNENQSNNIERESGNENSNKPNESQKKYDLYVQKNESSVLQLQFLTERESENKTATLVSASTGGWIRFWVVEHTGGLLGQFNAAHHPGESVQCMCVDLDNEYLFTADTDGYIKIWDITDYCIDRARLFRLYALNKAAKCQKFILHQHKGSLSKHITNQNRYRPPPMSTDPDNTWHAPTLLNSFKGHTQGITGIAYIDSSERLVTSSSDCSVRVWNIYGQFIGIFDQETPWKSLDKEETSDKQNRNRLHEWGSLDYNYTKPGMVNIPKDIQRSSSATTMRIFYGGLRPRWKLLRNCVMLCLYMMRAVKLRRLQPKSTTTSQVRTHRQSIAPVRQIPQRFVVCDVDMDLAEVREELKRIEENGITSQILGSSYKSQMNHKPVPQLPKLRQFQTQCDAYASLPFYDLAPVITDMKPPATLIEMQERSSTHKFQRESRRIRTIIALGGMGKKNGEKRRMSKFNRTKQGSTTVFSSGSEARRSIFLSKGENAVKEKLPEICYT